MEKHVLTWPELATTLYGKLTGRGAEITYEFEHLEICVPAHHAEDAPLARWMLNGFLKIRARDVPQG
jgi:hypothetical protein